MLCCWVLGLWIWRFNALWHYGPPGEQGRPQGQHHMQGCLVGIGNSGFEKWTWSPIGDAEILVKSNWTIIHLNFVVCQGWEVWYISLSWGLNLFNEWGDRGQASSWAWIPSDQRCKFRKLRMVIFGYLRIPQTPSDMGASLWTLKSHPWGMSLSMVG